MPTQGPGLYLITTPAFDPATFADVLAAALDVTEISCVRLALDAPEPTIRSAADALRQVCAARDVALVIAGHVRLAKEHGLDGVHLSNAAPKAIRAARAALGPDATVGAWAGPSKHWGMTAAEAGADYVAIGPVAAGALGDGVEAEPDLFAWWAAMIETPVVAEGGITPALARALAADIDFVAVRSSVWDAPEGPAAALKAYAAALAEELQDPA
jgi:thiamine-phosphate pyrophosphorylase